MRNFKKLLFTAGAAVISTQTVCAAETPAPQRRPNYIVMLIDDLAGGDLQAYGCPDIPTPHISRLAEQSVRCLNAYSVCPVCSPSRTGLITGRYPQHNAYNGNEDRGAPISDTHPTLAEFLRDAGYVTGMVGRWDIGAPKQGPLNKGFMEVARRSTLAKDDPRKDQLLLRKYGGVTYIQSDGVYYTDRNSEDAVDFITRHKDDTFFLYFAPLAVHFPVEESPQKYLDRVPAEVKDPMRRYFAATLIALDDAVGEIMACVNRLGLDENTVVIFTSDNGGWEPDRSRNAPFRGGKATEWEGGIRIPFLFRWTGIVPAGKTFDGILSTLDIYATAAALAGKPAPAECDGINLLPYMTGQSKGNVHEELCWRYLEGTSPRSMYSIRRGKWRLMKKSAADPWRLYDIEATPGEEDKNNLAAQYPEVAGDLAARYEKWEKTVRGPSGMSRNSGGSTPTGIGWATLKNP